MTSQGAHLILFILSLNGLVSARYTGYQGFITPDQSSGSLGALSSPGFDGNGRNAAIVDNGLLNPRQLHSSRSSLSSFEHFMDNVQEVPEQRSLGLSPNDPISSVVSHSVPPINKESRLPIENMVDADTTHKQRANHSPTRKASMASQIDITDQKRAFTVDQPTVKKAVNRRKPAPGRHSTPSPQQSEATITKQIKQKKIKQKSTMPKSIRFMSGNKVFRPGQRKAIYKFTGTSFTRSPTQTKRPPQETKAPKVDTPQESNNQNEMAKRTAIDRMVFGDIFTTESPVTIWRQSVARGFSDTTKSISVPISSHFQSESPTKPPNKKYSFVNPTNTALVGSHIITEDNPPSDIIVNHHETSLSERNRALSRSRYNEVYQTQKNPIRRSQRKPIKASSSLSSMKVRNNESHASNPSHVVSDPYAVADIIVSSNQQGALFQNKDASVAKQNTGNHLQNGERRIMHESNRLHNFNIDNQKEKSMREIVDFQNSGVGLGSMSNPQNVNFNSQTWVNNNKIPTTHKNKNSVAARRTHNNKEIVEQSTVFGDKNFVRSHGQTEIPQKHASISKRLSSTPQRPPKANSPSHNGIGRKEVPSHKDGHHPTNIQKLFSHTEQQQQRGMGTSVTDKIKFSNVQPNHQSHWQSKSHTFLSHGMNQHKHHTQTRNRAHVPDVPQQNKETGGVPNNSIGSSLSNPGVHISNTQQKITPAENRANNQHNQLKKPVRNQKQFQTQFITPEVDNVPYTIVDAPPSPAEYFHKSIGHMPQSENVKSVHKIKSSNKMYRDQNSQNPNSLQAEYNLRNDIVETRHYNTLNALPSSNSLSQRNTATNNNRRSEQSIFQMENANSLYPKSDYQIIGATRKGHQKTHQNSQNNVINQMAAKIDSLDAPAIDASFNIPKELISNPNIQMLNIENPVQSGYSLDGINILDIKPIKGLSPDIVQISKVTNKIPIIEIPINYNYYDTTTVPAVHQNTNLHTASSLASHGYASQTEFTKAPEIFQISTKQSCSYEANPFNKNQYAMSHSEALAGRFTSKCPAGLHFRADRCRCDWPEAPANSNGKSCHYVVNPGNRKQYANSIEDARAGKLYDCPASLHFSETKCRCDWPWP